MFRRLFNEVTYAIPKASVIDDITLVSFCSDSLRGWEKPSLFDNLIIRTTKRFLTKVDAVIIFMIVLPELY